MFLRGKKRGLNIEVVWIKNKKSTYDFRFTYRAGAYYYEQYPLSMYPSGFDLDDKIKIKTFAKKHIPLPKAGLFQIKARPIKYGQALRYP